MTRTLSQLLPNSVILVTTLHDKDDMEVQEGLSCQRHIIQLPSAFASTLLHGQLDQRAKRGIWFEAAASRASSETERGMALELRVVGRYRKHLPPSPVEQPNGLADITRLV